MNIEEMEVMCTTEQLTDAEVLHVGQECDSMVVSRLLDIVDSLQAECFALRQEIKTLT